MLIAQNSAPWGVVADCFGGTEFVCCAYFKNRSMVLKMGQSKICFSQYT